jgi:hypothetical protein
MTTRSSVCSGWRRKRRRQVKLKTLGEIDLIAVTAAQIGLHLTKFLAVLLAAHI